MSRSHIVSESKIDSYNDKVINYLWRGVMMMVKQWQVWTSVDETVLHVYKNNEDEQ